MRARAEHRLAEGGEADDQYLAYISPISRLYLAYISPVLSTASPKGERPTSARSSASRERPKVSTARLTYIGLQPGSRRVAAWIT